MLRSSATVRSSTEVVGFLREGGRIVGADLRDTETGVEIDILTQEGVSRRWQTKTDLISASGQRLN